MLQLLFSLSVLLPTLVLAGDKVSIPRNPVELNELKSGDSMTLPETRLDQISGMRPFTTLAANGVLPGVRGCLFMLFNATEPTILNSKTVWTVLKSATYSVSKTAHTFVIMRDTSGNTGRLTCREFRDGEKTHITNILDLKNQGSTFVFKKEVMPSTAIPLSRDELER